MESEHFEKTSHIKGVLLVLAGNYLRPHLKCLRLCQILCRGKTSAIVWRMQLHCAKRNDQ